MTTMRWMKGLVLAACLGTAVNSWGYVNDRVWNATTATNWNTAANWSGSAVPGATDRASFNNNAAGATVNLDINPTVSDFQFQTWNGLTVNNPAALLTVTNTFVFYGGSTVNFYPTLAVSNGVLTQRYSYDNRANLLWFYNFGNTFAGGIDTFIHSVVIDKNAGTNLFSGVIRAAGFCDLNGNTQGNQPGSVQIMSASNTFGVGRFELNRGGHIAIIQSADFSNITNIFFNGGMLHLGNIRTRATNNFPAYANGIQVSQGTLECYNDASLGTNTPFNRIVLGSSGHFGVLQGESENASGKYIAHPIVLNGNGGIINASSYGSGNNFSMTFLTDLGNIYHQYCRVVFKSGILCAIKSGIFTLGG